MYICNVNLKKEKKTIFTYLITKKPNKMKALKFLGIALLACGLMFTSCKKDNPEPTDNTSETPGGGETSGGGETPTNVAKINFTGDNTTWNAHKVVAVDKTAQSYLPIYFYKTADEDNGIHVSGFLESVVGSYTYATTYDLMYYTDPNFNYTDETGELGVALGEEDPQPGDVYSGWLTISGGDNFVENITAIDLNALTMSATFTQKIVKTADVVAAGYQVPSTKYDLNGTLTNASWEWAQAKDVPSKKASKTLLSAR